MVTFDPKELLDKALAEQPAKSHVYHPTIGGVDIRRPGSAAVGLLKKVLRKARETEPEAKPEAKPEVKPKTEAEAKAKAKAKREEMAKPKEKPKEKEKEKPKAPPWLAGAQKKESTDQAPSTPLTPGNLTVAPVKAPPLAKAPKITSGAPFKATAFKGVLAKPTTAEAPAAKVKVTKAPNAEEPFLERKGAAELSIRQQTKANDVALWKAYKAKPSKTTLKPLMSTMQPLIHSEVNRWKASAPQPVLSREAQKLTLEAVHSYDPNHGAALGTHVMNRLKKLSRVAYTNQDLVRLPENRKLRSQTYYNGHQELLNTLGREPTNDELADRLVWSPKRVSDVQRTMVGEYIESQDVGGGMFSDVYARDTDDPVLDYVYYDMTPKDKKIFEHITGYSGVQRLSVEAIAAKMGMSESEVRKRRGVLVEKIKAAK